MSTVHVVLPNDIDDPANPSGGNVYDRRVCEGLGALGWKVHEHPVWGAWPRVEAAERADLSAVLEALPDDEVVMLDGLISPAVSPEQARRLVMLVHMPFENEHEKQVLSAARAVVTTSLWCRQRLLDLYGLPADRVHAAPPGVDAAPIARGSDSGSRLLCVAAVAPHKGQDVLLQALAEIADLAWSCVCVGALDRDPAFAERLRRNTRVGFVGPRTGSDLDAQYAAADLLVLPSRGETYGMVVTEALAWGIPVLATDVGGVPEALGRAPEGTLVPSGDPQALAEALRRWLTEPEWRARLRQWARHRRTELTGWPATAELVASVLSGISVRYVQESTDRP